MSPLLFNGYPPSPSGYVWLVGAGPGAIDLITMRGRQALAQAEVVLYDDLANSELLEICAAGTEFIHVGKRAGRHSVPQDEINRLLVAHARAGRRVVRLKGGDPTVFGRLGEEVQALRSAGIAFEVVPGVTAACAAAAAAGVSLTQRGLASAAVLVTGHECVGKAGPALDWQTLAQTGATVCVYMGTRSLGALATQLLSAGRQPDTPLLIVCHASLPSQTIHAGTLESAAELVRDIQDTPALILIGTIAVHNRPDNATPAHVDEPAYAG